MHCHPLPGAQWSPGGCVHLGSPGAVSSSAGRRERSSSEQWCHIPAPVMEKVPPREATMALSCSQPRALPAETPAWGGSLGDVLFGMAIPRLGHIHTHACQAEHTCVHPPGTCVLLGHSTPTVTGSCSTSPQKTWFDATLPQGQLPPPMLHHLCRLCCSSPPSLPPSPFCCSQGKRWKSLHVLKKSYKKPSLMVDFWSGKSRLCRAIRD